MAGSDIHWRITILIAAEEEEERYFYVDADGIDEALKMARCVMLGIAIHPSLRRMDCMGIHREVAPDGRL